MDWTQTAVIITQTIAIIGTIVGSIAGLWHVFAHTTNAIREDINIMREDIRDRNNKYDAELKESRDHWVTLLQKIHNIEKKRYALEKERRSFGKKR